jgi:hypothetical protein
MKKIGLAIVALLVLAGGIAFFIHSNLDSIVKVAIEKFGSQTAQTSVRLESVKLSLTQGQGALYGLRVSNPKGFSGALALEMGDITMKLDKQSLAGTGPIIIDEISIDKTKIVFESDTVGKTNLQALERNAQAAAPAPRDASSKTAESRKIIINNLYVRDGKIAISHPLLQGKEPSVTLPDIHLTGIGASKGGATPAEVAQQILRSITAAASKAATTQLTKELAPLKQLKGGASDGLLNQMNGLLR